MTELTLTLIKLAFLAVLWLFVLAAVGVIRTDLFGERDSARAARRPQAQPQKQRQRQPRQPPARQSGPPREVVVTAGPRTGFTHSLGESPVTIGRAEGATLVLRDDYASSRHARLFPQDGQWLVEDLGSTNGTYLDRNRVTSPTPVPPRVPIRIGKTTLELRR